MRKKILLVDDDLIIANSEKYDIESAGYEVLIAGSGQEAVNIFHANHTIDLILMDIDLDDSFDGIKTAQEILKHTNIPIIFMSSHTEKEILSKTEQVTSYGYIVKGSDPTSIDISIKMAFKLFEANSTTIEQGKRLAESELQLRNVLEKSRDLAYQLNLKTGQYDYFSPVSINILGFTKEEFEALGAREVLMRFHPDDQEQYQNHFNNITINNPNIEPVIEYRWRHKNGDYHWYSDSRNVLYDEDNLAYAIVGNVRDISMRKSLEKELELVANNYKRTIDQVQDLIYRTDKNGNMTYVSPSIKSVTGYESDEVIGKNIANDFYTNPGNRLKILEILHTNGTVKNFEAQIKRKDGTNIWMSTNSHIIYDENGQFDGVEGIARNITEQKNAERILKENENTYRTIFENTGSASVIINDDMKIILANHEFEALCGLKREEIEWKKYWTDFVVPDDLERMKNQHRLRRETPDQAVNNYEFRFITATGNIRNILVRIGMIHETRKSIASLLDITKIKQTEKNNRKLLDEKEMLLKEVHHRIKNNLVMVQSLLSLHARQLNNPEVTPAFQDAVSRIDSIAILYDKIYKSDTYNEVLLDRYFDQLIYHLRKIYPMRNIQIQTNFDNAVISNKYASPLGIIVNELLTNSLKHAFPNNQNGKILITIKSDKGNFLLTYSDNGIGFDPDTVTEGFGLSLIDTLVKQIKANITTNSTNGTMYHIQIKGENI